MKAVVFAEAGEHEIAFQMRGTRAAKENKLCLHFGLCYLFRNENKGSCPLSCLMRRSGAVWPR